MAKQVKSVAGFSLLGTMVSFALLSMAIYLVTSQMQFIASTNRSVSEFSKYEGQINSVRQALQSQDFCECVLMNALRGGEGSGPARIAKNDIDSIKYSFDEIDSYALVEGECEKKEVLIKKVNTTPDHGFGIVSAELSNFSRISDLKYMAILNVKGMGNGLPGTSVRERKLPIFFNTQVQGNSIDFLSCKTLSRISGNWDWENLEGNVKYFQN